MLNAKNAKTPLLFLCHRIPYPPNKGDKIRAFHLLHHLSQHFDIFLATFVDDPADWPYVPDVEKFCQDSIFIEQKPLLSRVKGLKGLLTGEALSVPFYTNRKMHRWVDTILREKKIEHALVYSSSMAQYVTNPDCTFKRKIIDFVDIDSDKWQQYSEKQSWPLNWLYRREARCLLAYEKSLSHDFDAGLFVSSTEAALFRKLSPDTAHKTGFYNNGVNTEYFDPSVERVSPYPAGVLPIVFTGAMDYWPNVDAVIWFAQEVFPLLRALHPKVFFYIVGSGPTRLVQKLSKAPGVVVTGRVEDIRPYIQSAVAAVAPMRIARGVQNKVLEAMAMEKPVVVSTKGLEGIEAVHGREVLVADRESEYVDFLDQIVAGEFADMGPDARKHVVNGFDWEKNLPEVVLLLNHNQKLVSQRKVACHD
jgi:sugar transferase (PEP-CTERM/EpsH1 system associated)